MNRREFVKSTIAEHTEIGMLVKQQDVEFFVDVSIDGCVMLNRVALIDSNGKRYSYQEIEAMLIDDELPDWCDTSRWALADGEAG